MKTLNKENLIPLWIRINIVRSEVEDQTGNQIKSHVEDLFTQTYVKIEDQVWSRLMDEIVTHAYENFI